MNYSETILPDFDQEMARTNHQFRHRAILCVYLRLNDIPVPGMYDPSGNE
jgi:hypothetical protein